ncbi:hypothetical protein L3X38_001421 [Prunus dulcis]|uniref:Uncharacterized protein n=1 Tax=Prunus dulcis TaxID=3755 RepID=A0AAD4ZJW5_PRUDU|nr:hypothetical protein L3X38_001421 [Prunus dulcis]
MEEYIKEAPQSGSVNKRLEYQETDQQPQKPEESPPPPEPEKQEEEVEEKTEEEEEPQPKEEVVEPPPSISTNDTDLLVCYAQVLHVFSDANFMKFCNSCCPLPFLCPGLREMNPKAAEIEESNALALAIVPQGNEQ